MKKTILISISGALIASAILSGCGTEKSTLDSKDTNKNISSKQETKKAQKEKAASYNDTQVSTHKKVYDNLRKQNLTHEQAKEQIMRRNELSNSIDKERQDKISEKKSVSLGEIVVTPSDGKKLFTSCSGCHGKNGEISALGKSKIIANMKSAEIVSSLKGYQNKTYGGSMKNLMESQVSRLSQNDINSLANYISSLKK
jgi:cytochrome c